MRGLPVFGSFLVASALPASEYCEMLVATASFKRMIWPSCESAGRSSGTSKSGFCSILRLFRRACTAFG